MTSKARQKLPAPYSQISMSQIRCLLDAGVGEVGMACYALLTINHKDDTALCWCHVDRAAKELGISKQSWSNALSRLRSKTFTAPDGKQYPVLVKVKNAHSGQCATYADNPYAVAIGLPPAMPSKEGTRPQVPKRYTPTFTNQHGEGTRPDAERYTPRTEKVNAGVYPYEEDDKEEGIQAVGGALLAPQAKRSAATPQVVSTETQQVPRRLHHGISANTVPTYEEWLPIHEKLNQGKELTDIEKTTYSAGYHEYHNITIYRQTVSP